MEPMPFSCTRTRKSSRPRSTGRDAPGARPAEVAPGMVKNRSPKLWAGIACICGLVRVLSDGVGWNGDVAGVGCAVLVGVAGVALGVAVGWGGADAAVRAGAPAAAGRVGF